MIWIRQHAAVTIFVILFLIIASTLLWFWESGRLSVRADEPNEAQQTAIEALQKIQEENDELVGQLVKLQEQLATLGGAPENKDSAAVSASSSSQSVSRASGTINLNTASQAQLETLPGIGPSKAQAILAYQKSPGFKAPKDLMNVKGIGEKTYAKLAPLVTVE